MDLSVKGLILLTYLEGGDPFFKGDRTFPPVPTLFLKQKLQTWTLSVIF